MRRVHLSVKAMQDAVAIAPFNKSRRDVIIGLLSSRCSAIA